MKRLSVFLCGMALLTAIPANAGGNWGIRAGLNLVSNDIKSINAETMANKDSYTGFFVGPMAEFNLIAGLGIDASLLYSQKGFEMANGETFKAQALALPVLFKYSFGLGDFIGVFVQAGPQVNMNIGDLERTFSMAGENIERSYVLDRLDWSMNLGAGIKAINHIQFAVNYNIPLAKEGVYSINGVGAAVDQMKSLDFKASTLQFVLTYTF